MKSKILFVDDEPKFLVALQRMLHSQKDIWDMRFAQSVDESLEVLREDDFDMIISDVDMPGKNGFQFLEILTASDSTKDIPVVILTGAGEANLKRKALERGATDLLNKPVEPEDLLARIGSVLQLKSYQDQLKDQNRILEEKVRERTGELEASRLDILLRLAKAAEYRDEETGNHTLRVGHYCKILAEELGMGQEFVETISLASPLHDIGKIGIADGILLKPARLTDSEREIMETHCVIGSDILQQQPKGVESLLSTVTHILPLGGQDNQLLIMAAEIALCHHEKWDGGGYPQALEGQDIPLSARIVALADVYDALRSERPYKPAYSEAKTIAMITEGAGGHFDPMVSEAFEKMTEMFASVYEELSDMNEERAPSHVSQGT